MAEQPQEWGESLRVDSDGRLVELDDQTAKYLNVPVPRALGRPVESLVDEGLAQAIRTAASMPGSTVAWQGRTVRATKEEHGMRFELAEPQTLAPRAEGVFAEMAMVSCLEELRRLLELAGPTMALAGSLSVRTGQSGAWVPVATWGGAPNSAFPVRDCLALRTSLTSVTMPESPVACRHWQPEGPLVCVPVNHHAQPMLVSLAGCQRETAEALARAILGRTTHPDWQD